jgi:hypothetical protein
MTAPADARDYVADDFDAQGEEWEGEFEAEYVGFAAYIRSLPADDDVCERIAVALKPFLDNEARIDGTLYPDGDAMRFMVRHVPPKDNNERYAYAQMFTACSENDHARWAAATAEYGDAAAWTVDGGRPSVHFVRPHDEDPLVS